MAQGERKRQSGGILHGIRRQKKIKKDELFASPNPIYNFLQIENLPGKKFKSADL